MAVASPVEFAGSADQQALARRVWELMTAQAALYARDSQIKQSLENLATFFAEQEGITPEAMAQQIDAVVQANSAIFGREEREDLVLITTSRRGNVSATRDNKQHMFAQRLYEPANPLPTDDISNVVTLVRPVLTTVEPVQVSDYWRTLVSQPSAQDQVVEAQPEAQDEEAAPVAAEAIDVAEATPEPIAPAEPTAANILRLSDGTQIDLNLPAEQIMQEAGAALMRDLRKALDNDPLRRVVSFGPWHYVADALPGFGKNDLRRIRDYIVDEGQPVVDAAIATDLYRKQPGSGDFETFRFGLNQRLSREKDFEFVGTADQRQWSAKGLPVLGTKRVKASDLGPFYAHLTEGFDGSEPPADGHVLHYLSVFEWEYGVLPLNRAFASIMPEPLLQDQRAIVVRVDTPQHYGMYLAEVRLPTPNRGGWIWGLDEFFREYLVPGALITLAQGDEPGHVVLTYEESQGVEERLLHFEEKRNRFVFMPVTYYAAVDEDLLPSQRRYGKLRNLKPLPMSERRKFDVLLEHVFETMGEQLGSKEEPLYWIQFSELLLAVNVLRPTTPEYLQHVLEASTDYTADDATPGAYYYKPAPAETSVDDEEIDEDVDTFEVDDEE